MSQDDGYRCACHECERLRWWMGAALAIVIGVGAALLWALVPWGS